MALAVGLGLPPALHPRHHAGRRPGAGDPRRGARAARQRERRALAAPGSSPGAARWRIFGLGVTLLVLLYIPVVAITGLLALSCSRRRPASASAPASVATVAAIAIGGVVQMFIYPLFYCVLTVTYYDLRVRKEGFDLELLASTLQTA